MRCPKRHTGRVFVRFRARPSPLARQRVTISTDVRAAQVAISVRDAGTGSPEQVNSMLFTPFVTTKANGEGGSTFAVTLFRLETLKRRPGPPHAA